MTLLAPEARALELLWNLLLSYSVRQLQWSFFDNRKQIFRLLLSIIIKKTFQTGLCFGLNTLPNSSLYLFRVSYFYFFVSCSLLLTNLSTLGVWPGEELPDSGLSVKDGARRAFAVEYQSLWNVFHEKMCLVMDHNFEANQNLATIDTIYLQTRSRNFPIHHFHFMYERMTVFLAAFSEMVQNSPACSTTSKVGSYYNMDNARSWLIIAIGFLCTVAKKRGWDKVSTGMQALGVL